ncbi:1423_t:CDS:2 [Ambispora leptoticha]|uniref:tRNA-splicing endonuclease subunit Sen34 n=1 Tax=Ambispora leptoticha TaxID=144679 RepID=A0A9N9FR89_9GLOM|nr:1423_t:CDS:2 [Ambispora leptoticha]
MANIAISPPFKVYVLDDKAFVWDPDVVHKLRVAYRVVGSLIGTLPRLPMQNLYFGLPLTLIPEEVTLLLSRDARKTHTMPTKGQLDQFNRLRIEDEQRQENEYLQIRNEKSAMYRKEIGIKIESHATSSSTDNPDITDTDINQKFLTTKFSPIVHLPTTSNSFAWYNEDYSFTTIKQAAAAKIWCWPSTKKDHHRFKVFSDLWKRGYFITNGIKFGGDFLLYSGDPLRYHSQIIATIVDINRPVSALDIITFGRIGTITKKSQLLCSWDEKQNKAVYISFKWAGLD